MKFSLRIPIITAIILMLTIGVNLFGLKKSIDKHLPPYIKIQEENNQKTNLNPDKLSTILSASKTTENEQEKYDETLQELNSISKSLESLAQNPELYITDKNTQPTGNAFALVSKSTQPQKTNSYNALVHILSHPFSFEIDSPEGQLFKKILYDVLILNAIWFLIVFLFYFLWIRHLFSPIHLIIDQLQEIIQNPENSKINYKKNDEFRPLINALNKLQTSLNAQEKIRSHFLADLSHEIRTPITSVKCYLEAIQDGVMELDDENLGLLQKEITRLITITDGIMNYESLINEQTGNTKKRKLHITKITNEIISQYFPQLQKTSSRIKHSFTSNHTIFADENQYRQILHNIFSNFIKYAGDKSTLQIDYQIRNKKTYLVFCDDGVGIPEDKIEFARKKFFKGTMDRQHDDANPTSMGIGLSIVDRIMTLHDGTMQLHNNTPHGLVITLYFPEDIIS
ncbi:HAMP domain-containing histidine kinase [Candidatus Gracilibacteria bacterium]|nr:HAMP domain-containing histidine kinase [Candidatus Gracilibacteria bacterium]